jgi:hypothetical protein
LRVESKKVALRAKCFATHLPRTAGAGELAELFEKKKKTSILSVADL